MILGDVIYKMLMDAGMDPSKKGFGYWERAIAHRVNGNNCGTCEMYAKIAHETHAVSPAAVERAMRTAIDTMLTNAVYKCDDSWYYVSARTASVKSSSFLAYAVREAKKRLR